MRDQLEYFASNKYQIQKYRVKEPELLAKRLRGYSRFMSDNDGNMFLIKEQLTKSDIEIIIILRRV